MGYLAQGLYAENATAEGLVAQSAQKSIFYTSSAREKGIHLKSLNPTLAKMAS